MGWPETVYLQDEIQAMLDAKIAAGVPCVRKIIKGYYTNGTSPNSGTGIQTITLASSLTDASKAVVLLDSSFTGYQQTGSVTGNPAYTVYTSRLSTLSATQLKVTACYISNGSNTPVVNGTISYQIIEFY